MGPHFAVLPLSLEKLSVARPCVRNISFVLLFYVLYCAYKCFDAYPNNGCKDLIKLIKEFDLTLALTEFFRI